MQLMGNITMSKEYKNWIQSVFDRSSKDYGQAGSSFFSRFGGEVVKFADLSSSKTILDVATGKGAVLIPIAEKLNGQGNIYGIDLSLEMLKAIEPSKLKKFNNIQLQQMDAEHLTFSDHYFDTLFCAFALFFLPNPVLALKEFRRVLKRGGALYLSLWDEDTYLDIIFETLVKKLSLPRQITANKLHSSPDELHQLLKNLGFPHLRFKKYACNHVYDSPEQWWNSLWSHGSRGCLDQLNQEQLLHLKNEAFNEIKIHMNKNGQVIENISAIFIEAK